MIHKLTRPLALAVLAAMVVLTAIAVYAGTTGIISGVVTDATTGAKLSGVNIVVKGTGLTTVTDAKGYFVITNVPPGAYEVAASLVGYEEGLKGDVQVVMDATSPSDLQIRKTEIQQQEVIIKAPKKLIQPDMVPTLYMMPSKQEKMVKSQPNMLYQIPGVVGTQPGITMDPDGKPHIRGGRGDQIGYMLEGIPVTEPLTNLFGTNMVTVGMSKMQIYTGGYRAEYGNAISGVLNEIKKTGSEAPGGSLDMVGGNQAFGGSYMEYGGSAEGGLDFYVASYLWRSQFDRQMVDGGDLADNIGKFVWNKGDDKWTLLINQGTARYYLDTVHTASYLNVAVPEEEDHNHQKYDLVGLTFSHNFSPSSFLTIRPYSFRTRATTDALGPDGYGAYIETGTTQRGLQTEYTNQINSTHLLKAGASVTRSKNRYLSWYPAYTDPDWGVYHYISDVGTLQSGIFLQDQAKLSDKWRVEAGVRYDGMNFDRQAHADITESQISPRMGATYTVNSKNLLKASWGKFIQFPPSYVLERDYENDGWTALRPESADLYPERSVSYDFSWERQLTPNMLMRVTPFYRKYTDLLQSQQMDSTDPFSPSIYINSGEGVSRGIEGYLSKKFSDQWEGWLSYTVMKAKANASAFNAEIDPNIWAFCDWDQRHTLNAVVSYKHNDWTNDVSLYYGTGYADVVTKDFADQQKHGHAAAVLSWNVTKKLPEGSRLGDSFYINVWNIFNTGKVTRYAFDYYGDRTEDAWIVPRFITTGVTRRF